jgi:hypothetical protein
VGKLLSLKTAPTPRAAIIDEFGDLTLQRAAFAPTEKRYAQLRDELKSWYADAPGHTEFVERGRRYQLTVSAAANSKTIDIRAAYKKLGLAKFLKACSLTLKALAEFLSEPDIEALTTSAQTGARGFVSTPYGQPAEQAAELPSAVA